jgi:hypothetical protein
MVKSTDLREIRALKINNLWDRDGHFMVAASVIEATTNCWPFFGSKWPFDNQLMAIELFPAEKTEN